MLVKKITGFIAPLFCGSSFEYGQYPCNLANPRAETAREHNLVFVTSVLNL